MKKIFMILPLALFVIHASAQSVITIDAGTRVIGEANTDICAASKSVSGELTGDGTWCNSAALPVELVLFLAVAAGDHVELLWSTASEVNNHGFAIERRLEFADEWYTAGFVEGSGTSTSPQEYSFIDSDISDGHYVYRLRILDRAGDFSFSPSIKVVVVTATQFVLHPNYPNPFNPITHVNFRLPIAGLVKISVFDVLGREVAVLVNGELPAGTHTAAWNAEGVVSGLFFCRMEAESVDGPKKVFVETKKLVLLR